MTTLKLTARGQITISQELRQHLGIKPGEKIDVVKDSDGSLKVTAAKHTGRIEDFFGILAGKTDVVATIEEIKEATERAWAGKR